MATRRTAAVALAVLSACLAAGRPAKEVMADLKGVGTELAQLRHGDAAKYNPLYKQQMAREYGPLYEREQALLNELAASTPKAAAAYHHLATMDDARLAAWEVPGAADRIATAAASTDPATATDGKLAGLLVRWWTGFGDAGAQDAVVTDLEAIITANPTSGAVADATHLMACCNPASVEVGQRLTTDLTVKLVKTPLGKAYAAVPNKLDMPLAVDGTQLTGKTFKSSAWAGKVVLVDFWATWCPPCREEIPHVAKVYEQYHGQGLEIIGVSSDNDKAQLASFLKQHPEMPWPELFAGGSGWHPLTKKFGINSIPTMYLIDRNGNLRTTEARSEMDKLIPVLLAETYTPAAKATPAKPVAAGTSSASGHSTPAAAPSPDAVHDAVRRAAGATMH